MTGVVLWAMYILAADTILPNSDAFKEFLHVNPHGGYIEFIAHHEITFHLGEISQILFFLLGAMTIVEMVDSHEGFKLITDKIKTTNKIKLLWILSVLTFYMLAVLDNLTTTIVMVALLRKLIDKQQDAGSWPPWLCWPQTPVVPGHPSGMLPPSCCGLADR